MSSLIFSFLICTAAIADDSKPEPAPAPADKPAEPSPPTPPDGVNTPLTPIDDSLKKPRNPPRKGPPGDRAGGPPGEELSPDRLKALRTYKHESLSIRRETEVHGGGYDHFSSVQMNYGTGPLIMTEHVSSRPVYTTRSWGIYQGPERITTPEFLKIVGDQQSLTEIQTRIHSNHQKSKRGFTVAGIGGAGVFVGIMGMSISTTEASWQTWNTVTLISSLTGLGGMIGGSLPASKASQLERHPRNSMSTKDAQDRIDTYNESLRDQLGLTPKEVWLMEMGEN